MSDGLDRSEMGVEGLKLEEGFTCAGRNIPVVGWAFYGTCGTSGAVDRQEVA